MLSITAVFAATDEITINYHLSDHPIYNDNYNEYKFINSTLLRHYLSKNYIPNRQELNRIGQQYNIPHDLLYAMFWKESNYQCGLRSNKNAVGCFQFIDETAEAFNIKGSGFDYRNNPWVSADAAARYLAWNFNYLGLDNPNDLTQWQYAVAAYNAGPGKIKTDENTLSIPLYTETQFYVEDIIGYVLGEKHIVELGELIKDISERYTISETLITLLNGQVNNQTLKAGQFISIRKPVRLFRYVVKSGDNLSEISSYSGLPMRQLARINNISSFHNITVGQVIYLPIYGQ
jgi:LysM repeat protein